MGEFPNKSTQFSSTNQPEKNGRPKGTENSKTRLLRLLKIMQKVENPVTGDIEEYSVLEQMDMKLILKALGGDVTAYREILDRLEGKALQESKTTMEGNIDIKQITGMEIK